MIDTVKRLFLIIVIICALLAVGIFVSWWLAFSIGLAILGILGHVERIYNIKWSRKWSIILLILFVLLSGANIIKSKLSEKQIADLSDKEGELSKELKQAKKDRAIVEGQISDLIDKDRNLGDELEQAKKEIRGKDARILELERQTKVIRSIDGNIECFFSGKWAK